MPSEVQDAGPCKRLLKISVPGERVKEAMAATWLEAQRNASFKGFRPGKVPRSILEKKLGKTVRKDVQQQLINDAFHEAVEQHKLRLLRQPQIDLETVPFDPNGPFELTVAVDLKPDFAAPEFRGIEVIAPPVKATPELVERELEQIRAQRASVVRVEQGVATKGDFVLVDVSYQVDGAIVLHHEDALVDTIRDQVDGVPAQGATAMFAGREIGATVSVEVKLPDDFKPSGFAGARANLLCSMKRIHRITLPELNEDLARDLGAESVDDLKSKVETELQRRLESQRDRYIEECVFDQLIKKTPFDLPEDFLADLTNARMQEFEADLVQSGMPEAEAKSNVATHADRIRQDQARGLRISLLAESIALAQKLFVTEDDMQANIRALAAARERTPQEVYDELYDSGQVGALRSQILEHKVRKLIRQTAKVSEGGVEGAGSRG
ncbi:MAG: trigger factor [Planctomycetes bacterium]|nr:trigger factor [Planctomycetota bacterium]